MPPETVEVIAIAALAVAAVALLLAIWLLLRTRRLSRLGAFRPQMPADLQSALEAEVRRTDGLTVNLQDVRDRLPLVEREAAASLHRVGIVRFNPFADTGGQQSFVVALLDAGGTGFLISSLHSRQATRLYLKQISGGRSDTALSDEESEAIRRALAEGDPAARTGRS